MVYHGKPSQGCHRCRLRKIKCDQSRPACYGCIRVKATCPGYRDPVAASFRDQSQDVERKVLSRKDRGQERRDGPPSYTDTPVTSAEAIPFKRVPLIDTNPLSPNPSWPIENQATGFFFRNYVSANLSVFGVDLPTLSYSPGDETIDITLASIGLAGLSNLKNAPGIMYTARLKYAAALRRINRAVQDPAQCRTDSTLLAVMLMSMFEPVASSNCESLISCSSHTNGIIALLKVRGTEHLQHETELRIFHALRTRIILSCNNRRTRVPHFLHAPVSPLRLRPRIPLREVGDVLLQLCNIRADMREDPSLTSGATLSKLLQLESQMTAWVEGLPSEWTYSTVTSSTESDDIYQGTYHVYQNAWIASVLLHYHCFHITIHRTILECLRSLRCSPVPLPIISHDDIEDRSRTTMLRLCGEICASVPFFLGYTVKQQHQPQAPPESVNGFAHGFNLIWPLQLAARVPGVSDARRRWIMRHLEKIGRTTGIYQALGFASSLRKPYDPISKWNADLGDEWARFFHTHHFV